MKAMALTGKVVHAGYNNGLYVICNPSGTMGARQKRYRKASDAYKVNCKSCLKKLAAAEAEAYAEDAERARALPVAPAEHMLYARTFSATTRHIVNTERDGKTLCGSWITLPELFTGDDGKPMMAGRSYMYDLPSCIRCEKSAAKRGLIRDRRIRSVKSAELQAYAEDIEHSGAR